METTMTIRELLKNAPEVIDLPLLADIDEVFETFSYGVVADAFQANVTGVGPALILKIEESK